MESDSVLSEGRSTDAGLDVALCIGLHRRVLLPFGYEIYWTFSLIFLVLNVLTCVLTHVIVQVEREVCGPNTHIPE